MHTPIKSLMERFCDESAAIQNKYGRLLEIINKNDALDAEIYEMKLGLYEGELRRELAELMEKYKKIAHKDSHADREKLDEQLKSLQEKHCGAFLTQYDPQNMSREVS